MLILEEKDVVQCTGCRLAGTLSGADEDFAGYYCPNCGSKIAVKEDGKILATESTFALIDCTPTLVH